MANHSSDQVKNAKRWRTALHSESVHATYYLASAKAGLIKHNTDSKMNRVKAYLSGSPVFNRRPIAVGNAEFTTTKLVGVLNDGIAHSPLKEMAESSQRTRKIGALTRTILLICKYYHIEDPHFYLVTMTIPNAPLGHLKNAYDGLDRALSRMRKAVHHGRTRKSGLHLIGADGQNASWIGDFKSIETTVNKDALTSGDPVHIFHPHVHMMLITDGALDMKRTRRDLFSFWRSQFPKLYLDPEAFDLRPCYDKYNTKVKAPEIKDVNPLAKSIAEGFEEVMKYIEKPDVYKALPSHPNDFALSVFSELYNAQYGRTFKRSTGIGFTAQSFINFNIKNGLGNAILNANSDEVIDDHVPDLMTHRALFDVTNDNGKIRDDFTMNNSISKFSEVAPLTARQMLFFNADILRGSGLEGSLFTQVKFKDSKKAQLYKYIYQSLLYSGTGRAGLLKKLAYWLEITNKNRDVAQSMIDHLLDQMDKSKHPEVFKPKLIRFKELLKHFELKFGDLSAMKSAVDQNFDDRGHSCKLADYRLRIKVLRALKTMKSLGFDSLIDSYGAVDVYDSKYAPAFDKFVGVFGDHFLRGNKSINQHSSFFAIAKLWFNLFNNWRDLGFSASWVWDDDPKWNLQKNFWKSLIAIYPETITSVAENGGIRLKTDAIEAGSTGSVLRQLQKIISKI